MSLDKIDRLFEDVLDEFERDATVLEEQDMPPGTVEDYGNECRHAGGMGIEQMPKSSNPRSRIFSKKLEQLRSDHETLVEENSTGAKDAELYELESELEVLHNTARRHVGWKKK